MVDTEDDVLVSHSPSSNADEKMVKIIDTDNGDVSSLTSGKRNIKQTTATAAEKSKQTMFPSFNGWKNLMQILTSKNGKRNSIQVAPALEEMET